MGLFWGGVVNVLTSDLHEIFWADHVTPLSYFHSCVMSASGDVTILPSSCLSAPWPPTRPPAPTPTRPREWTWPTASPTCGSKPRSTAWTRCPRSTERRGRGWGGEAREGRGPSLPSDPCRRDTVSGMRTTSTHPRSLDRFYTYMQKCWTASDAGFSPQAAFYFFLFWFFFHFLLSITELSFVQKKDIFAGCCSRISA